MSSPQRFYAVTICAKRKPGMSEGDYHKYISEKHAPHLKDLLVKNKIVDYTMVSRLPPASLFCFFCFLGCLALLMLKNHAATQHFSHDAGSRQDVP